MSDLAKKIEKQGNISILMTGIFFSIFFCSIFFDLGLFAVSCSLILIMFSLGFISALVWVGGMIEKNSRVEANKLKATD